MKILAEAHKDNRLLTGNGVGFAKDSFDKVMEERFHAVLDQEPMKGSSKAGFHVWCIGMAGLLVCSYMFIIAPYYEAENMDNAIWQNEQLSSEEMWISVDQKGRYIVHFLNDGKEIEQVLDEEAVSIFKNDMEVRME